MVPCWCPKSTEIPHLRQWSHTVQSTIKWPEKDSNEILSAAGGSLQARKVSAILTLLKVKVTERPP